MKFSIYSKIFWLIFIGGLLCANYNAQNKFQLRVNFSEFANFTYQIDCLSDAIFCHKDDFAALWEKEFLQNDDDKKVLASWKTLRNRYQESIKIETGLKFPLEQRQSYVNLSDKLTIAGLQSKNPEDYLSRLDLLVVPREREGFAKVIKHFAPRFSLWWKREANVKGTTFVKKIEDLLASENIKTNLAAFYNFYQPNLPENYVITFDLIFRPDLVKSGSSAFSLENHLPVEFFFDEEPKRRIDVVIHEFCHFMLNSISPEKHIALQNIFLKSGRATAIPAFNLLDESLAAALANGIIARSFIRPDNWQKYLSTEGSFYSNPNIDRAGKAILPLLDDWLAKGGRLNDEAFVTTYLDTLEKAFGENLNSPQIHLAQAFLFIDEKFDSTLQRSFRRTMNTAGLYSEIGNLSKTELMDFFDNTNLNAVFVIQPESLNELSKRKIVTDKASKEIQKIYQTEKKVLYSVKRNENAFTFIVVADNTADAEFLIKVLANSTNNFVGKYSKTTAGLREK